MEDHDQRFKTLVQTFVVEFLTLFFADLVSHLDLSGLSWLDKKIFPDPPSGARYSADLIARIPVIAAEGEIRPNEPREQVLLLHIEIESADTVAPFRKRMFDYWTDLSRKLDQDILPLAVYLRVGLQGRGKDIYERRIWACLPCQGKSISTAATAWVWPGRL